MRFQTACLAFLALWMSLASAAGMSAAQPSAVVNDWSKDEFQFRFVFGNPRAAGGKASSQSDVYLYVPADAPRVRALLLLQQNVVEQMIAVRPAMRDPASGYIAAIPGSPDGPIPVKPYTAGSAAEQAGSVWFFDKELAEAAVKVICGNGPWARACQLIGYDHPDGTPAPFGKSGLVNPVPYQLVSGTNEIQIFPVLLRAFPAGFQEAGQPLNVSSDPTITLEYVCGPYLYLDPDGKYRIKLNRGGTSGYLVARNRGDGNVRPTVQPTRLVLGGGGGESVAMVSPGNQQPGAVTALKSGRRGRQYLGYYVDHGPARVVGDKLEILPLPANTRGPLEVQLVGYCLDQGVTRMSSVTFHVTK